VEAHVGRWLLRFPERVEFVLVTDKGFERVIEKVVPNLNAVENGIKQGPPVFPLLDIGEVVVRDYVVIDRFILDIQGFLDQSVRLEAIRVDQRPNEFSIFLCIKSV
jgi:hypothetical protein